MKMTCIGGHGVIVVLGLILELFVATASPLISPDVAVAQDADRIVNLPGQPLVNLSQYAGYVTVNQSHGRELFYWFIEAMEHPDKKPLVLWLNGGMGPGCSSIGLGQFEEIGVFFLEKDVPHLILNNETWMNVANVIFLDSPVGVGFSYTKTPTDLDDIGDNMTAVDSYNFLLGWFKRFPNYKSHDFYIVGESYAGHYAPQLAEIIVQMNQNLSEVERIHLKGIMLGNPVLDDESDNTGMIEYAWDHAVISDELYQEITLECNFTSPDLSNSCYKALSGFFSAYEVIDQYSLYTPTCVYANGSFNRVKAVKLNGGGRSLAGYDPCAFVHTEAYLNRPDVQRALHANVTNITYPWTLCSSVINKWVDSPFSVLPIINNLVKTGLRIWIYSGDTDGRISVTGTRLALHKLGLKINKTWSPWFTFSHQVGGFIVEYNNLTFVTVRGAGHEVPVLKPRQALQLIEHFINGTYLPTAS